MGFGFKQPLVGEKRCVTTLITAAKETKVVEEDVTRFTHKVIVAGLENVGKTEKSCHFVNDQQPLQSKGLINIIQFAQPIRSRHLHKYNGGVPLKLFSSRYATN